MRLAGILLLSFAGCMCAQTASVQDFNPLSASTAGVHIYSLSVNAGDYLGGSAGTAFGASAGQPYATGLVYGASAAIGWMHSSDRSTFSASYLPSYFGSASNSNFNTLNHQLSLSGNVRRGKWTFNLALAGAYSNLQQLLFSPTTASYEVSVPSTFDDLAAAMLAGKFTNAQLAAILTGSPLPQSPTQSYLYGQRILAGTLSTGVSWSPTSRTSFHATVSGMRAQNEYSGSGNQPQESIPDTTTVAADIGWSYSLSPRTQISIDASSSRILSGLQKGYVANSYFSLARTMSRRWFVQLRGGGGLVDYSTTTPGSSRGLQYVAGGTIGYKVQSHTFTASYDHTAGDLYGSGASATKTSSAAWRWRRPGSSWTVSTGFEYQQLVDSVYPNATSWRANASIARALNTHIFVSAQYGFYQLPADFVVAGESLTQSAIMMSLSWTPSTYR